MIKAITWSPRHRLPRPSPLLGSAPALVGLFFWWRSPPSPTVVSTELGCTLQSSWSGGDRPRLPRPPPPVPEAPSESAGVAGGLRAVATERAVARVRRQWCSREGGHRVEHPATNGLGHRGSPLKTSRNGARWRYRITLPTRVARVIGHLRASFLKE